jgi:hypothetical protein
MVLPDESHQYMTRMIRREENILSDVSRVDTGRIDMVGIKLGNDGGDDTYNGRGVVRIISRATRNPSQRKKSSGENHTLLKFCSCIPPDFPCPTDQLIIVM